MFEAAFGPDGVVEWLKKTMTPARLDAGREYLAALRDLGFVPDGAVWSMRLGEPGTLELSLFSDLVDRVGPHAIYRALFDAYERAKTPADFDPWIVGLYSPRQTFFDAVADFDMASVDPDSGAAFVMRGGSEYDDGADVLRTTEYEVVRVVHRDWVYKIPEGRKSPATEALRNWRRFERSVAEAA
ncbi:hypothetical protein [Jiella avicenniae]|uniref:Uncharacterized protein n=1 Tax=Jiella avicenniae TaxID=2907202 RepID=A0A9X1P720_9HYPH|nr:hypothetical protein [Jiella avicenniae]MCE7031009.1 hypothetical protein [Jiella avicenniae]